MYSQEDNYDATERSDILQEVKCPVFSTKMFQLFYHYITRGEVLPVHVTQRKFMKIYPSDFSIYWIFFIFFVFIVNVTCGPFCHEVWVEIIYL